MVMTKIECYLPAIYRLNQEERSVGQTPLIMKTKITKLATLSYMLINFLVWALQCTKSLFFHSFILSIKTFFSTFLAAKKARVRQKQFYLRLLSQYFFETGVQFSNEAITFSSLSPLCFEGLVTLKANCIFSLTRRNITKEPLINVYLSFQGPQLQ